MSEADERRLLTRLRTAHRVAGIGTWEGTLDQRRQTELHWSPEVHEIAGWPPGPAPTFPEFVALIHPDDRPGYFESRDAALDGRKPYAIDLRMVRPDGDVRHVHIAAEVVRRADGAPQRVIGVIQDRTGEIESFRRLRVTEASRRQLLERLLDASDRERERVARNLAGGPLEQLRRVEASMAGEIGEDAPEAWHEALDSVRRSIESLDATLSTIAGQPAGQDLATLVAELAADTDPELGVTTEVEVTTPLRPAVRSVVVRLVQEGLQNIRKHARASRAEVTVRTPDEQVHVRIADDGQGFDPESLRSLRGHFGIASLRDDVTAAGGRLVLDTGPGGTVLEAHLPVA